MKYRIFIPENEPGKFEAAEDRVFEEYVFDFETGGQFKAKIMVSQSPMEGYEPLAIQVRGDYLPGNWYAKIVEREDEEEEVVTVFQPAKLSERRGYMLRSMMEEEKLKRKRDIMGKDLEEKEKEKRKVIEKIRKQAESK